MLSSTRTSDAVQFIEDKRTHWNSVWVSASDDLHELCRALADDLLFDGPESGLPRLDALAADGALTRVKPRTGFGVDMLRAGDLKRLPTEARDELGAVVVCLWRSRYVALAVPVRARGSPG